MFFITSGMKDILTSLEKRVQKNEKKIGSIEDAIILLTQLAGSHDERLVKSVFDMDELRAVQRETQDKMNALIDAQIRGEDQTRELDKKMAELAEVVKFAHERIDKIE